jgi:DNA-binding NarL/FixJ family response regulator
LEGEDERCLLLDAEARLATNETALAGPAYLDGRPDVARDRRAREHAISVLVVDSQTLFRVGLARLLGDDDRLLVIGVSAGDRELPQRCAALSVDVMVADLDLGEINGIELTRQVGSTAPGTRVLLLASRVDWRVIPAMASGAAGFLLKDSSPEAIRSAVVAAHLGEKVLCPEATEWLVEESPTYRLTRREVDVLRMVAEGADNGAIAQQLGLQQKTVRNYVSRLYRKLASQNRAQIAAYAFGLDVDGSDGGDDITRSFPVPDGPWGAGLV